MATTSVREPKAPTKEPKFYTKRGLLTAYSFACGKVQQNLHGVQMWREHACYHILRQTRTGEYKRFETYSLKEARKTYSAYTKAAKEERRGTS